MDNFGQKLKSLRKSKKITLLDVEKKTGISNSYLSQVENGKRGIPNVETLSKLADLYQTDLVELLMLTGQIKDDQEVRSMSFDELANSAFNFFLLNVTDSEGKLKQKYKNVFGEMFDLSDMNTDKLKDLFSLLTENEKLEFIKAVDFKVNSNKSINNKLIKLPTKKTNMIRVPVLGKITAGLPITAVENVEDYQYIYNKWNYDNEDLFLLRVSGDSMINSRIFDGDLVLVKSQSDVENGEIAVVSTDGEEATLKRVKKINGSIILFPDNPKYEPLIISNENAKILGKVIQVIFEP